jgi:vitamin B12 transporter
MATTEGTENFVAASITDRFGVRGDYTFTRAVNADTGMQLLRRPKEKWGVTATWNPLTPLNLSATVLHVSNFLDVNRDGTMSGFQAPGYAIVNLTSDYAINDQLKVFGRIDNLFNVHYQNPTGFLAPGRLWRRPFCKLRREKGRPRKRLFRIPCGLGCRGIPVNVQAGPETYLHQDR